MTTSELGSNHTQGAPNASKMQQAALPSLSTDAWRLLVEAEIDAVVRELRKNALFAEVVERDGIGALWVGGSRWPGLQESSRKPSVAQHDKPATDAQQGQQDSSEIASANSSRIRHYVEELASRRTLGKAGVSIGLASFADRSDEGDEDDYAVGRIMMLESFLLLREIISGVSDPRFMDAQTLLDPFVLVIKDAQTTGPITRCTLVSMQRFINHGIIDFTQSSNIPALLELARAVTHCRFEATDAASDEAVLMQILNVLGAIVLSSGGHYLSDEVVCEIMETVLSMSCQMRLSEMLRKSAESTLFTLVTFVFGKLNDMQHREPVTLNDADSGSAQTGNSGSSGNSVQGNGLEPNSGSSATEGTGEVSMIMPSASKMLVNMDRAKHRTAASVSLSQTPVTSRPQTPVPGETSDNVKVDVVEEMATPSAIDTDSFPEETPFDVAERESAEIPNTVEQAEALTSFSLPAIRELYRVLVTLTNPRDLQYTDSMRLLALNTLQVAFQTAGSAMAGFATLRELTLGDLSHYLLVILQRDQPNLISPALRVLYLLFASHRRDTKGHLELFLCQTLGRIMSPPVLQRQGSRASLRGSGGHGSGYSTPKLRGQRVPAKARILAESGDLKKPNPEVGLGITDVREKDKASTEPSQHEQGAGQRGGRRRRSTGSFSVAGDGLLPQPTIPHMSPLLDNENQLTNAQEVELYNEASLKKGVRGRIATHETRRQLLEGLHHLITGDESLIIDLWVNYDCDIKRGNMYDFLVSFITQRAVPWPEAPDDSEYEAFLDMLLFYLTRIACRAGVEPPQGKWAQLLGLPSNPQRKGDDAYKQRNDSCAPKESLAEVPLTLTQLQDKKKHKDTMSRAAQLFNEKPKDGIAYLQKVGALPPDNSTELTQQLARFLFETPTINKKLLGEFLAKPSNLEVLRTYIELFDFSGRRLDEAMRSLLGTFRLPGESQQIERIMETFSEAYFASDPADVASKDAAFILAYAIIMLNTDLHSPQVKNRMRFEDFTRNLRGVNDGEDFRHGFLMDVYKAIKDREIVFPEEHEGEAGFEYAWREVSSSDASVGAWASTRGRTAEYDRGLLAATWPRLLRALARILTYFTSDHTLRLTLSGLHALVASAAHYGLSACVDECLHLLVQMTGLADSSLHSDLLSPHVLVKTNNRYGLLDPESPTSPLSAIVERSSGAEQLEKLQEQEDKSIQLTRTALEFGKNYRGQVAFIALFEFASQWPEDISKHGWLDILDAVRVVIDADIMPHRLLAASDLVVGNMWVPRIHTLRAMDAAKERIKARQADASGNRQESQQGGGLFSTIASFWGGSASSTPEPSSAATSWRWRESPELLAHLVGRSKQAVQASHIDKLQGVVDVLDTSLPAFLAVLAEHFPKPPPSHPNTPAEDGEKAASGDVSAGAEPSSTTALLSPSESRKPDASEQTTINYSPASIYFFELAVALVQRSPLRAPVVWSSIEQSVQRMLEYADTVYHFTLERMVSGLLRIAISVLDRCTKDDALGDPASLLDVVERVLRCLGLLRDANDSTFNVVALELAVGIGKLIDTDGKTLVSVPNNWEVLRQLIKRLAHINDPALLQVTSVDVAHRSLMVLVEIVILIKCGDIDASLYFVDVLDVLAAFMPNDRELLAPAAAAAIKNEGRKQSMSAAEVASKLVALLYDMQQVAKSRMVSGTTLNTPPTPALASLMSNAQQDGNAQREPSVAGSLSSMPVSAARQTKSSTPLSMWLASMNALAGYACTAHKDIRHLACAHIQKAISADLAGHIEWVVSAFHRVLFPLMDTLLRADLLADKAMEDTHARCISMVTMFFLHNIGDLQNANESVALPLSPKPRTQHFTYPSPSDTDLDSSNEEEEGAALPLKHIWLRLIRVFSVYIHTGNLAASSPSSTGVDEKSARRGHLGVLAEMAEENIKNCMLVLDSMGIFGDKETNGLWRRSWGQLDKVNPQLKAHVFPSTIVETAAVEGAGATAIGNGEDENNAGNKENVNNEDNKEPANAGEEQTTGVESGQNEEQTESATAVTDGVPETATVTAAAAAAPSNDHAGNGNSSVSAAAATTAADQGSGSGSGSGSGEKHGERKKKKHSKQSIIIVT
ncbi:GDP/GTP exchange factor for ARF [Dipsacomyces acuminosporus]|nr:GDP/GTP exchange factor for ARF [Dipsacomyces acuminosporus]